MLNQVIIEGRIANDLELKKTSQNQDVLLFNIAHQDGKDNTVFMSAEAWGKVGEHINKYYKKGDGIEIVGKLSVRKYVNKEGKNVERYSIVVEKCYFPISKKQEPAQTVDDSDCPY